jgi:hypothetical protein
LMRCLNDGDLNDVNRIKKGSETNDGQMVWAGGDACWNNYVRTGKGDKSTWNQATGGCLHPDYVEAATKAIAGKC